jgi:hypothetical protein
MTAENQTFNQGSRLRMQFERREQQARNRLEVAMPPAVVAQRAGESLGTGLLLFFGLGVTAFLGALAVFWSL